MRLPTIAPSGTRINRAYTNEELAGFTCACCGACCRIKGGIVRLSEGEIARIAAYLGLSEEEFINRETVVSPDRRCLVLKDAPDGSGACGMLDDAGFCRIHPVKPDQCASFPYDWVNDDSFLSCIGLKRLFQTDELHA